MRLTDLMPMPEEQNAAHRLVRIVECLEGSVVFDVAYQPRPDYARQLARLEAYGASGWLLEHDGAALLLQADMPLVIHDEGHGLAGTASIEGGQRHQFDLALAASATDAASRGQSGTMAVEETVRWWENWCGQCFYRGHHQEAVMRSCLTLKLLTYQSSGAVMAAATTSLPESMAAPRNWDYRYCWLRDTSLLLQSFIDMGFRQESGAFFRWLLQVGRKPRLKPFYDQHGRPVPKEVIIEHLEGFRGRGPVRIGNSAHHLLQLDIYGDLIQTSYRFVARGGRLSKGEKHLLAVLGDSVCLHLRQPDHSIWETRTQPRHFTYSKLMCWVALDRLIALHQTVPLDIDEMKLRRERDLIRQEIDREGFNPALGSYVGYFGGEAPDASLLLMVRYEYLDPEDPRIQGTYRYIMEKLAVDGFLYRYPPGDAYDGVEGEENLFAVCSFWLVDYLARSGKVEEAMRLFERLLDMANDVGLYSEQFDTESRMALGNFPQAFTHSGLITAALAIDQALHGRTGHQITT
jgi:GH15 family glucan-1,4-alpha-glucosidase